MCTLPGNLLVFDVAFDAGVWGTVRGWKRSLYKRFARGITHLCQWIVPVLQ